VVETFRSTNGGDKGRSDDRADPGDRGQPASLFVLLRPADEFSIEGCDPSIELRPLRAGVLDEQDHAWEPQHASIPTTQAGSFSASPINVSRLILRRMTTASDASSPTTLQTFLPRSTPRTAIFVMALPPPETPASHDAGRRGGPFHKLLDRGAVR
jgi:hypothetical protein